MIFRLFIDTDNATFDDGNRECETARILRGVVDRLEAGEAFLLYETLFDRNGNGVGRAAFKQKGER